jgi:simple sugar transport system permease protein
MISIGDLLLRIFSSAFLATLVRVSVPLICASLAAYIASLAGIPNIAVEGEMLMAALFAAMGGYWTGSAWAGLLIAIAVGVVMALILPYSSMKLGTSPILVGIALNTFATSFTVFLLYIFTGNKGTSASLASPTLPTINIPFLSKIPILGPMLNNQYTITYICIVLIVLLAILVYKTPFGLQIKACGLDENAARSVGINVNRVRVIAVMMSGTLAALGGAYMTMGYLTAFTANMIAGRGWIGIAAQSIGGANMLIVGLTTAVFGVFQALSNILSIYNLPSELVQMIPYAGVLLGFVILSVVKYYKTKKATGEG